MVVNIITEIFLDGLERSGNTFLGGALGYSLGIQVTPLWSHRVYALESRNKDYPFIVPVRDALPCMVSSKIYRDYWEKNIHKLEPGRTGDPQEIVVRHLEYIKYVVNDKDLFIAPFKEFSTDHNSFVDVVVKSFPGLKVCQRLTKDEIIEKIGPNPNPHLNSLELRNFPRDPVENKESITKMFISDYSNELQEIQSYIEILYKRYYTLKSSL